jgi:hypothetical protein
MGRSVQVRRIARGIAVLAPLVLLATAASAIASRKIETPSKISIKTTELRFHGRVTSSTYPSCQEDRRVVLYKVIGNGPDEPIGRTATDEHGAWSLTVSGYAGISLTQFYAKVRRSGQGAAGTIYVCDAARSKTIRLGS